MRYLTKSRFAIAITCPTKLSYLDDPSFANSNIDNDFLSALAEGGHQVGALAKCLFPGGIEIDASGHDAQVDQTNTLLAQGDVVLFEAAIRVGRLFIRADVLRKEGNRLDLFEVKAKSFNSEEGEKQIVTRNGISQDFRPYLYDVAFQKYVLQKAFPNADVTSHLVMPNKAIACPEPNLAQRLRIRRIGARSVQIEIDESLRNGVIARQLLHILPVDRYVETLFSSELRAGGYSWSFEEGIQELEERLDRKAFEPRPGSHCKGCEFRTTTDHAQHDLQNGRRECWRTHFGVDRGYPESGTILDLYSFRGIDALAQEGRVALVDLEPEDVKYKEEPGKISLPHRQWLQCEESRDAITGPVAIRDAVLGKLDALRFPLHFIDFETATPALPFHADMRPYELIFFQFSHHRVQADGRVTHQTQHLAQQAGVFPNFESVRALSAAIGDDDGSVIHWWTHERTVLAKVREQLLASMQPPADRDSLITFVDSLLGTKDSPGRLVDLGQHIVHPFLFLPGTKGSSSIKKTLPAILRFSGLLKDRYSEPTYGTKTGIQSLNFHGQTWYVTDPNGNVLDPYTLLQGRFGQDDLDSIESAEDGIPLVANGGSAMIAYYLLQNALLSAEDQQNLVSQLLRYCELDTLAMVMVYEGLRDLTANA